MYKEIIDNMSMKVAKDNQKNPMRKYMYASDVFQCKRKIYYEFFDDKSAFDFTPEQCRIFQNGDYVHKRLMYYLRQWEEREEKIDFDSEVVVPVHEELKIHGRMDVLVYDNSVVLDRKQPKHILEFKSINVPKLHSPKKEHMGQLTYYLHQMRLETGFLIYESKSNQRIFEFEIKYDPAFMLEIEQFYRDIWHHVNAKTVPELFHPKRGYPCQTASFKCKYWIFCHNNGMKEQKYEGGIRRH
jgi:hypothetical protein